MSKFLNPNWTVKGFDEYGIEVASFSQSSVNAPSNEIMTNWVNNNKWIKSVKVEQSFKVYGDVVIEGEPKLANE